MFPGYNQFPKSNTPGPDGQPNPHRAQYNDQNQNMFPQFDAQPSNNPKSPYFEEDNDNVQVPQHIKFLFSSNEKPTYENPNQFNLPPGFNRIAPNNSQSPYFQPNAGQGVPFQGFNLPNYQADQQNAAQAFQSERSSSNQSGNSRTMSINDASQELSQRVDPNTSERKNTSSKAQLRHKNSQKVVNEDINLIERIETILNQVTLNHNKVCPFCSKFINLKRSNFQNISAFQSHTTNKYYLTHFDCYLKSKTDKVDDDTVRIVPLVNIVQAALQPPVENSVDLKVYKKSNNKKAYFVSIEGFHPISSYLLFKLDKVCNSLEHSIHHNQMLNLDFSKKTTSFFEPKLYMLPFNDFKIVTTIQVSHSDEDPYVFEYLVDLSKISIGSEQPEQTIEASYTEDNNNIKLVFQILYDTNNDLKSNMNQSMSLDVSNNNLSTSATAAGRPEFGRNVFLLIKQFTASLPLTNKVEFKGKSSASLASSEGTQRFSASNRLPNKINIIPDAPLFGNTIASPMLKPQVQPNFPQNVVQQDNYAPSPGLKNNNTNPSFKPYGMINQTANNGNNNYFNVPLFNQNMQFPQGNQRQFGDQDGTPNNNDAAMPPGLLNGFAFDQPFSGSASPFYQNQQNNNPNFDMNFPPHHKQSVDSMGGYGGFPDRPQTPETHAQSDSETPSNRGRKGPVASLRTEVLMNNVRRDSSMSNSPSLNKIQRDFFSGVSTPRSDTDPNPIGGHAPLSRFPNFDTNNDLEENSATLPLTEDMIENFKLEDYKGRLVEFAKSYHGSRILQKFFPKANQQEIDFVIYEIQDKMEELMLDSYANYMFQTLAQSCSSEQRYYLLQKLAPSMIRVARDRKGTHSLQAIVSLINRDVEDKLIKQTLEGHVFELAFDAQATHLIQKLITSISLGNIGFIYEPIIQRFVEVANNSFGLCVLKQLMTKVDKVPDMKVRIINLLHDNLEELIQNPYGNYAVQHALDIYPLECGKILDRIIDKIVQYSNQKFSSNVIEKCFVNTSSEYKKKFVAEIIKSDRLLELMKNKYGNYVILKILSTSEVEEKRILAQSLLKNVNSINVPKYKNHWLQFLEENPMKIPGLNVQPKPSLFKPVGPDPYSAGSNSEVNSPGIGGDQWGYNSQEGKRPHKDSRDEKSQFYHEKNNNRGHYGQRNSGMMNQQGGWEEGYDDNRGNRGGNHHNYQQNQNQQNWFEVKNFNKNNQNQNNMQQNPNGDGQGGNGNNSAKKPNKNNFNQKFYEKNQYYSNKGGYNNFY